MKQEYWSHPKSKRFPSERPINLRWKSPIVFHFPWLLNPLNFFAITIIALYSVSFLKCATRNEAPSRLNTNLSVRPSKYCVTIQAYIIAYSLKVNVCVFSSVLLMALFICITTFSVFCICLSIRLLLNPRCVFLWDSENILQLRIWYFKNRKREVLLNKSFASYLLTYDINQIIYFAGCEQLVENRISTRSFTIRTMDNFIC